MILHYIAIHFGFKQYRVCMHLLLVCVLSLHVTSFFSDQLNTSAHATVKATPFELVFGQPPQSTIFLGVTGHVMEEDIKDLLGIAQKHTAMCFLIQHGCVQVVSPPACAEFMFFATDTIDAPTSHHELDHSPGGSATTANDPSLLSSDEDSEQPLYIWCHAIIQYMTHCCMFAHADFAAKFATSDETPLQSTSYPVLDQNLADSMTAVNEPCSLRSDKDGQGVVLLRLQFSDFSGMTHCCIFAHADFTAKFATSDETPLQSTSCPVLDHNPVNSLSAADPSGFQSSDEEGEQAHSAMISSNTTLYHIFLNLPIYADCTAKTANSDKPLLPQLTSSSVLNQNPVGSLPTVNDPISLLTSDDDGKQS